MRMCEYLTRKRVAILDASDKATAISGTLALLRGSPCIADYDALIDAIWDREESLPTGIGLGIGVPHVRLSSVRDPVAALTVLRKGIDYGSMDGEPVRVILLIAMPDGTHKQYLEYLAKASRLFQDRGFRKSLLACTTSDALWDVVKDV